MTAHHPYIAALLILECVQSLDSGQCRRIWLQQHWYHHWDPYYLALTPDKLERARTVVGHSLHQEAHGER